MDGRAGLAGVRRSPTSGAPAPRRRSRFRGSWPSGRSPSLRRAIRDERREEGPAAWIGSIGRQLERFAQDELPFAVLLVDLGDVERLRRAALPAGLSSLARQVEHALDAGAARSTGTAPRPWLAERVR